MLRALEEVACRGTGRRIEAHVERSVLAEGKAAPGLVEMVGTDPEIKEDAGEGGFLEMAKVLEIHVIEGQAAGEIGLQAPSALDGLGVAVQGNHEVAVVRLEDGAGMAAAPEGGIQEHPVPAFGQIRDNRSEKNRHMSTGCPFRHHQLSFP